MGRSHALALAALGAKVVVNDLGTSVTGDTAEDSGAAGVVAEIRASGGSATANGDSVATAEGGRALVEQAMDTFGRIDVLVNNAGVLRDGAFEDLSARDWELVRSVHLDGAFHVTQPVWRHMKPRATAGSCSAPPRRGSSATRPTPPTGRRRWASWA
jgi:NAD(P)-dependent dehydrogenase (short-subunit alcohol dehydrogenase family)